MANSKEKAENKTANDVEEQKAGKSQEKKKGYEKKDYLRFCAAANKILFVIIGVIAVLAAVAMIIVTVLTSIATKAYDADMTNRVAALLLLAVTAGLSICTIIYGETSVFRQKTKVVYATAFMLLLLAIIQTLVGGIGIAVDKDDEVKLLKALAESYGKSRTNNNSLSHKIWAETQNELNCCGLYGPEDYRSQESVFFAPDVPISCCPSYDGKRSEASQERERQLCRASKAYYSEGCKDPVLSGFLQSATVVISLTVLLVVSEILLLVCGGMVCRVTKKKQEADDAKHGST